jgi:hypothetical protein
MGTGAVETAFDNPLDNGSSSQTSSRICRRVKKKWSAAVVAHPRGTRTRELMANLPGFKAQYRGDEGNNESGKESTGDSTGCGYGRNARMSFGFGSGMRPVSIY